MTKPTESNSNHEDTLGRSSIKRIKGIGNVKQTWLRRVLNIRTIEELAEASAQDIEEELRQAGHPIHQAEILDWIDQAKALLQGSAVESISDPGLASDTESTETLTASSQTPQSTESIPIESTSVESTPVESTSAESMLTESISAESAEWSRTKVTETHVETVGAVVTLSENDWQPIVGLTVQVDHRTSRRGIEYRSIIKHQLSVQTHTWTGMDLQQGQEWMLQHLHDVMQDVIHSLMQLSSVTEQKSSASTSESNIQKSSEPTSAAHLTSIELSESAIPTAPLPQEPSAEVSPLAIPPAQPEGSQPTPVSVSETGMSGSIVDSAIEASRESFAESTVPPPRITRVEEIALEIAQLKVFQPPFLPEGMVITRQSRIVPQALSSQQPFAVEVQLKLTGQSAAAMTQHLLSYEVHAVVHDRESGENLALDLSRSGRLANGILTYTARLPEMTLQPGRYRLRVLGELQEGLAQPGSFNVPLLQVI